MRRVIWSKRAEADLEALNDWFAELDPGLPLTLTLRIEHALTKLLDHPHVGAPVPDSQARKWRIRRTPYLVFFRPTADGIRILKVRHARSNWKTAD